VIDALDGATVMEVSVGGWVTVSEAAELVIPPSAAVMFALPAATPVATAPLMVAAAVFELAQTALPVRFCVLPLL
jgi:hypothetical protein